MDSNFLSFFAMNGMSRDEDEKEITIEMFASLIRLNLTNHLCAQFPVPNNGPPCLVLSASYTVWNKKLEPGICFPSRRSPLGCAAG